MSTDPIFSTPLGGLVAGLLGSMSCSLLGGPLLLGLMQGPKPALRRIQFGYHLGRFLSLSTCGGLAGAFGLTILQSLHTPWALLLAWGIVGLFAVLGVGLESWIPAPPFLQNRLAGFFQLGTTWPRALSGFCLGLMAPLFPCGVLSLAFLAAFFSSSAWKGAQLLGAFSLGNSLLVWFVYEKIAVYTTRLPGKTLQRIQGGLFLAGALLLFFHLLSLQNGQQAACF